VAGRQGEYRRLLQLPHDELTRLHREALGPAAPAGEGPG
jgi:hypothetical protein